MYVSQVQETTAYLFPNQRHTLKLNVFQRMKHHSLSRYARKKTHVPDEYDEDISASDSDVAEEKFCPGQYIACLHGLFDGKWWTGNIVSLSAEFDDITFLHCNGPTI